MYYFEVLTVFLFFLLLSAFFMPFFGGCIVFILVFLFLGGLIVFFSLNFVWLLAFGLIIYAYGLVTKYLRWHKLPDVNQYLHENPQCKLASGVCCNKCSSEKLNHFGLFHATSKWRFYSCAQCGTLLFRFKVL